MRLSKMLRVLGLVALVGVLAAPAMARLRVDSYSDFIPGVNSAGALSWSLGNFATVKVYNYTNLDILTAVVRGKVTNQSGRVFADSDLGSEIYDYDNAVWRISTSDVYVVGPRRGTNAANASGVGVYIPGLSNGSPSIL